jgi:hypothetical protein
MALDKMKYLRFKHGGKIYVVSMDKDTMGHVTQYGEHIFSLPHPSWVVTGFTKHHMRNYIEIKLADVKNAEDVVGMLVWDVDHGTTRQWGGAYNGKVPRVEWAVIEEIRGIGLFTREDAARAAAK